MPKIRRAGIQEVVPKDAKPAGPKSTAAAPANTAAPGQAPFTPPQADVENSGVGKTVKGNSGFDSKQAPAKKKGLWGALGAVEDGVKSIVQNFEDAFNIDKNVDSLKSPGDTYTAKINGEAYVEAGAYGTEEVDVQLGDDGKYTVSSGGELGAGIWAELGGKIGAKLDAQAFGTLGVGLKTEMKFDNAADAKRAAHLLARDKQLSVLTAAMPTVGGLLKTALGPSAADRKFLVDHTSALAIYGDGVADINAIAGLKIRGPVQAGLFGDSSVTGEAAIRVDVKDGKVAGLTVQEQVLGDVNLGVGLYLAGEESQGWTMGMIGGDANAQVTSELHYDAPKNLSLADLTKNPLGTLRSVVQQMGKSQRSTVTVDLNAQSQVNGAGKGVQLETRFEGNPNDLLASGALKSALHGKIKDAVSKAGKTVKVDVTKTPYQQTGIYVNPGVSLMGVGVEAIVQGGSQIFGQAVQKFSNHRDD